MADHNLIALNLTTKSSFVAGLRPAINLYPSSTLYPNLYPSFRQTHIDESTEDVIISTSDLVIQQTNHTELNAIIESFYTILKIAHTELITATHSDSAILKFSATENQTASDSNAFKLGIPHTETLTLSTSDYATLILKGHTETTVPSHSDLTISQSRINEIFVETSSDLVIIKLQGHTESVVPSHSDLTISQSRQTDSVSETSSDSVILTLKSHEESLLSSHSDLTISQSRITENAGSLASTDLSIILLSGYEEPSVVTHSDLTITSFRSTEDVGTFSMDSVVLTLKNHEENTETQHSDLTISQSRIFEDVVVKTFDTEILKISTHEENLTTSETDDIQVLFTVWELTPISEFADVRVLMSHEESMTLGDQQAIEYVVYHRYPSDSVGTSETIIKAAVYRRGALHQSISFADSVLAHQNTFSWLRTVYVHKSELVNPQQTFERDASIKKYLVGDVIATDALSTTYIDGSISGHSESMMISDVMSAIINRIKEVNLYDNVIPSAQPVVKGNAIVVNLTTNLDIEDNL